MEKKIISKILFASERKIVSKLIRRKKEIEKNFKLLSMLEKKFN